MLSQDEAEGQSKGLLEAQGDNQWSLPLFCPFRR